jgi:hypothetical protein
MNLLRLAARVATPILDALWPPFDEAAAQRALAAHESFGADLSVRLRGRLPGGRSQHAHQLHRK